MQIGLMYSSDLFATYLARDVHYISLTRSIQCTTLSLETAVPFMRSCW